ncbi:translation initiation factor IF-5A [Candidatus Woesearchaeota archaeon]|jgi:translation initiation factor 5A|nr:translation initiation factor IF-5A [Candidatus Woesearchaeota archaeon]MBT6044898.1 translation initiation factor IF-5A [Candidatus Woesearchaeota archaeon]
MSTKPVDVGSLKVGSYVVVDGVACTVKSIQISRPGKHGHAKSRIEAVGIIDGQKKIFIKPSHDKMDSPIIEKETAQVISVSGDSASVMDLKSFETFDLKIPSDLIGVVVEGVNIIYWVILKDKVMKQIKKD